MSAAKKPDLADAFVRGDVIKKVNTPKGKAAQDYRGTERKKVSFAMRPELHHRLKVAAAVHQRDMSEILEEALTQFLDTLDAGGDAAGTVSSGHAPVT